MRLGLFCGTVLISAACLGPVAAQTAPPAYLNLGGYNVLCLRGTAGGLTPEQRVDVIMSRVTPLLGTPVIRPSDVAVYVPPATSRYNRYPVIYALGRRIVTADPATVKASGLNETPLQAATTWAKTLQQVLPRVNWRPSNMPEPKVPKNPPLLITHDFEKVGGDTDAVTLRDKIVLKLRGPQNAGMTAAERGDLLSARLKRLANAPDAYKPDAVQVTGLPDGSATLMLAGTSVLTVTAADSKAAGQVSPDTLAQSWAKNLRLALASSSPVLPSAPAGAPPSDAALPPTLVPPTVTTAPSPQTATPPNATPASAPPAIDAPAPSAVTPVPPATAGATAAPTPGS